MHYFACFINSYIKENNYLEEKNKTVFIFSVHMKRTFKNEKNQFDSEEEYPMKEILNNSISYLFDFYHIFIDNLNGEDISIVDITSLEVDKLDKDNNTKNFELFRAEKIDINNFLISNYKEILNQGISMIDFLIKNINRLNPKCLLLILEKTQSEKIIELIINTMNKNNLSDNKNEIILLNKTNSEKKIESLFDKINNLNKLNHKM